LRCGGQKLTWCKADPEGETFDVARLLHSGQPAGSGPVLKVDYVQKEVTTVIKEYIPKSFWLIFLVF